MYFDKTMVTDLYDTLTGKIKTDLDAQYTIGRLTGSDYANVYAQLMGQCLQLAYQTPIQDKDIELKQTQKDEMIKNGQSDRALKESQKETQDEQTLLVRAETAKTKYESDYLLPSQKTNYDNQASKTKAETDNILPAQKAEIEAQTSKINKDIDVEERRTKIAEDQNNEDLLVKQQQIASMQIENSIKQAQSDEDLKVKEAQRIEIETQINKINKDIDVEDRRIVIAENQSNEDLLVKQQQIASNQAQEQVYIRQKQGFDDKLKMDLTKMQLDSWSMMFSSGLLSDKPKIIGDDSVTAMYASLEESVNIESLIPFPVTTFTPTTEDLPKNSDGFYLYIDNFDSDKYGYTLTTQYGKLGYAYHGEGVWAFNTPNTTDSDIIILVVQHKNVTNSAKRVVKIPVNWK